MINMDDGENVTDQKEISEVEHWRHGLAEKYL